MEEINFLSKTRLPSFLLLVIVAFVSSFCLLFFTLFSSDALCGDLMLKQHKCIRLELERREEKDLLGCFTFDVGDFGLIQETRGRSSHFV